MAVNKTSLSAGLIIRAILTEDTEVSKRTKKIYPVVQLTEPATLPYIAYRRMALEAIPAKRRDPEADTADTVAMEVICYTADYDSGVELAEAVRNALTFTEAEHKGLVMRGCQLADSQEDWENDAFVQQLIFNLKM